jgi:ATP-dependent RNA helicase RhlE
LTFSDYDLDPRILRGVDAAGYITPTPIQAAALPPLLAGRDLIGTAQTGTGKTAAFVLPMLQRLTGGPRGRTRALVVTPTRELAAQIHETINVLGRHTGLSSATIYGGVGMSPQEQALRRGVDIIVACPGRLLDHLARGTARLGNVEVLVLDEADMMFDMGFLPAVRRILAQVPAKRQTMLFSATFPPEVDALASAVLTRPERVAVGPVRPATTVSHALYPVPQHLKAPLLLSLLPSLDSGSVLVFTRTRHRANKLAQQLGRAGHKVAAIHGDRSQGQREAALDGFKSGKVPILVATDIAARGLDIEGISHVINFDIPNTTEAYIHRIGRTGRAERIGDAYTLITPDDAVMVKSIERAVGQPIERLTLRGFDYTAPAPPQSVQPTATAARGGRTPVMATNGSSRAGTANGSRGGQAARPAARPATSANPNSPRPAASPAGNQSTGGQKQPAAPRPGVQLAERPATAESGPRRRRRRSWQKRGAA